jgi:microcin C transport system ATP-binding protein
MSILSITNLGVNFRTTAGEVVAVRNANLKLGRGDFVALVGESGSGKSVLALSILRLLQYGVASHPYGEIIFGGENLLEKSEAQMCSIRGNKISMIFQEPMTALNPLHTIEKQISEVLLLHKGLNRAQARKRCLELLELVGLEEMIGRIDSHPHNLSGGQRQRVMIAMALANEPEILIADEPTTALDVTVQAQILDLIKQIQQKTGMAVLFITHNLNIVKRMAGIIYVMKNGEIVESGNTAELFNNSAHPYTRRLLGAQPKGVAVKLPEKCDEILEVKDLSVAFAVKRNFFGKPTKFVNAVIGANFNLKKGETIGIVGESGSGKTTLAMAILRLIASQGSITFGSRRIDILKGDALRPMRKEIQVVFQDPFASLNPRMSVGQIVSEGLKAHDLCNSSKELDEAVCKALKEVGLDAGFRHRYPHEFSGGQRQRIAIARALILNPKLIILDEPTSALDVTVQAQVLDLLKGIQEKRGVAYIFISHDLGVVKSISHKIIVMKNGAVVEQGLAEEIFSHPANAYTKKLISASMC